jgi:hypothetical protein
LSLPCYKIKMAVNYVKILKRLRRHLGLCRPYDFLA